MKKILVITQHIFPIQTPRSLRSTELIKELSKKGHCVTVYAVIGGYDYSAFEREHKVKIKGINLKWQLNPYNSDGINKRCLLDRALARILGPKTLFPDIEFYVRVKHIIKKERDTDVIISIANPHPIHWGVAKAKKELKTFPKVWIGDCGDPFMNNNINKEKPRYFEKYERLFCENVNYISIPVKEAKEAYYPEYKSKLRIIPQGFNFDFSSTTKPNERLDLRGRKIKLIYAGVFIPKIREPYELIEALKASEKPYELHIYTPYTEMISSYEKQMRGRLYIHQVVPRETLLEIIKNFDVVVNVENSNTTTQVPSKLIDYAISGKPILSIKNGDFKKNKAKIDEFLRGDFSSQMIIPEIERYHISNVVEKFEELFSQGAQKP